jgi:hypothetical protein
VAKVGYIRIVYSVLLFSVNHFTIKFCGGFVEEMAGRQKRAQAGVEKIEVQEGREKERGLQADGGRGEGIQREKKRGVGRKRFEGCRQARRERERENEREGETREREREREGGRGWEREEEGGRGRKREGEGGREREGELQTYMKPAERNIIQIEN